MSNTIKDKAERGSVISTILDILKTGDKYGYEIIKEVEEKSGVILKQPSLYSCLTRLESQGIISSYWQDSDIGGRRHYYKYNFEKDKNENNTPVKVIVLDTIKNKIIKISPTLNNKIETYSKNDLPQPIKIIKQNINLETIKNKIEINVNNKLTKEIETFNKNQFNVVKGKSIQELLENEINANNNTIKKLTNTILAYKEQVKLEEEIKLKATYKEEDVKTYTNIQNKPKIEKKTNETKFAQQYFDFDNVESLKKYQNNVLLKTVSKQNNTNKKTIAIEHFSSIGDLTDNFAKKNIEVKEFSYTNYTTLNKNKYITNFAYFICNIIELIVYIALSIISSKTSLFKNINIAFIFLTILQSFYCIELFIITFKDKFRFLKRKIWLFILISFVKIALSVLILFINEINIFKPFNAIYLILLVPFTFIILQTLSSKKAEKF